MSTVKEVEKVVGMTKYKTSDVKQVKLAYITPDENQPRKYFNAEKLKTLKDSIKQYGIINPIIVQEVGKDQFLIEDGERRYRAASDLKLDTVPVIVRPVTSATDRLVQQFNIQEQHEAWTPIEKASAIVSLSGELGISLGQTCKLLNINHKDGERYASFASLIDKEHWVRSEVPLDYAIGLRHLQHRVRNIVENELEEDYNHSDEKKLEHRVVTLIKTGTIIRRTDLNKLTDAFVKNPKLIRKFLDDAKSTPVSLFSEAKAKGAYHLRNVMYSCRYLQTHGVAFMESRDVKLTEDHVTALKSAIRAAQQLIALAE